MLEDTSFDSDFIICKNLTRPLILGRDFLIQNHIAVRYSENGKCILDHQQQELIAATDVEIRPHLSLTNSISLPGRTLAVIYVNNNLSQEQSGHVYKIEPNYLLKGQRSIDSSPLTKNNEIYVQLKGSKVYSTFDVRSGYYHMVLSEKARPNSFCLHIWQRGI